MKCFIDHIRRVHKVLVTDILCSERRRSDSRLIGFAISCESPWLQIWRDFRALADASRTYIHSYRTRARKRAFSPSKDIYLKNSHASFFRGSFRARSPDKFSIY